MKYKSLYVLGVSTVFVFCNFDAFKDRYSGYESIESLRKAYETSTANWPIATVDSTAVFSELAAIMPPVTLSKKEQAIADLGKVLFYDQRLSSSNSVSCATCHIDANHWADKEVVAIGHQGLKGTRNTPSIENVWIQKELFWDGRATSLQEQQIMSIENHVEMFQDINTLSTKLKAIKGYAPLFKKAFGHSEITKTTILDAIATFQRTIVSNPTPFDAFVEGDFSQLSDEQVWGLHLFRTKARCINCHSGAYFTDMRYHNEGFTFYKRKREDLGRYTVSKDPTDVGKIKTPGLRNVVHTGPWFHNGLFANLASVVGMYNAGMNVPYRRAEFKDDAMFPVTSEMIQRLVLSDEEQKAIISFLEALSSDPMLVQKPILPN